MKITFKINVVNMHNYLSFQKCHNVFTDMVNDPVCSANWSNLSAWETTAV